MFRDAKKALYVFLCGILGSLLFLIIQRSLLLIVLVVFLTNPQAGNWLGGITLSDFWVIDTLSLVLALGLGGWYGVWLGIYWYSVVYEKQVFPGFVQSISEKFKAPVLPVSFSGKKVAPVKNPYADFWEADELLAKRNMPQIEEPTQVVKVKPKAFMVNTPPVQTNTNNVIKTETPIKSVKLNGLKKSPVKKRIIKKNVISQS